MRRGPFSYLAELWAYYTSTRPVRVRCDHSLEETRKRLLELNAKRDVHVRFTRRGELIMVATAHARGPRVGTPIIPEVRARLDDEQGGTLLHGEVGLNAGTRIFLAMFVAIWLIFALQIWSDAGSALFMTIVFVILLGLMVFGHSLAREDFVVLTQRLAEATGGSVAVK